MKKPLLKNLIAGTLMIILSFIVSSAVLAQTDTGGTYNFANQSGLNTSANEAGYDTGASATSLEMILSTVIYTLLSLVGLIFFGLLVMGGFTWMTAEGNEEKVKKATSMVVNALIGLIITLSAYALSYFLISYFW